jgi:Holliday junction resolvase
MTVAKDKDVKTKPAKKRNGRGMKAKGDAYERELAAHINGSTGLNSGRAPLSGGGKVGIAGGADLLGTPFLFVEAKRTERLNVREALRQAETNIRKTKSPEAPIVITRMNREATGDSLIVMRLDSFLEVYRSHLLANGYVRDKVEPDANDPLEF